MGLRTVDPGGLQALTHFRTLQCLEDGSALVEAVPKTGRTNQIRIHLWSMGLPVMGDPSYQSGGQLACTQTVSTECPPMCLHAWSLAFSHPVSGEAMCLSADPPSWAAS